jgi:MAF protein
MHDLGEGMLILASASPRRRVLLGLLGIPFRSVISYADETLMPGVAPERVVAALAASKAACASEAGSRGLVVAADTVVALGGEIMGKPRDAQDAVAMLKALRGRWHRVWTGMVVLDTTGGQGDGAAAVGMGAAMPGQPAVVRSDVLMRRYSDHEIERYVASGDPLDKAAAYAIQHAEFRPVARLRGCYANVMGLPVCRLAELLGQHGLTAACPREACTAHLGIECAGPEALKGRTNRG